MIYKLTFVISYFINYHNRRAHIQKMHRKEKVSFTQQTKEAINTKFESNRNNFKQEIKNATKQHGRQINWLDHKVFLLDKIKLMVKNDAEI